MQPPDGLGTAISAIYSSRVRGTECALLVAIVHSGEWTSPSGETGIDAPTLADRVGVSTSTARDALAALRASGVIVERERVGRSTMRRIDWQALASYSPPVTKRGGVRTPEPSEHRTPPNIGSVPLRTPEPSPPNTGGAPPNIGSFPSLVSSLFPEATARRAGADAHRIGSTESQIEHLTPIDTDKGNTPTPPVPPTSPPPPAPVPPAAPRTPEAGARPLRGRRRDALPSEAVLSALAEVAPDVARRVAAGGLVGIADSLRKLVQGRGEAVAVRRLRYIARVPGDQRVAWWRSPEPLPAGGRSDLAIVLRQAGNNTVSAIDTAAELLAATPAGAALLDAPTVGDWRAPDWTPGAARPAAVTAPTNPRGKLPDTPAGERARAATNAVWELVAVWAMSTAVPDRVPALSTDGDEAALRARVVEAVGLPRHGDEARAWCPRFAWAYYDEAAKAAGGG